MSGLPAWIISDEPYARLIRAALAALDLCLAELDCSGDVTPELIQETAEALVAALVEVGVELNAGRRV